MARSSRRRARLGSHTTVAVFGVVFVVGLLVLPTSPSARQTNSGPPDPAERRLAAERGDADAQHDLGVAYQDGDRVRQSDEEAVHWFRRAAEQGHIAARHDLGVAYANGTGVAEDAAEAVRWFRLAADQGYAVAQYNLAVGYANGMGVPQDPTEAARWYRLAADRGHGAAPDDLVALEATMTAEQIVEATRLARVWRPGNRP